MSSLVLSDVSLALGGGTPLFDRVSLRLERGRYGVVGANGAGKSTLLALVRGALHPDEGAVRLEPRHARIAHAAQEVGALDARVQELAHDTGGAARALRDRLGLDPRTLARWPTLSPGERRRWQLAAALAAAPDVLLVDEPTNHLDAVERARVRDALGRFDGLALVVSHDRALLDAVTTGTVHLDRGRARMLALPYSRARAEWEREAHARADARARAREAERSALAALDEARRARQSADAQRSSGRRMKGPRDHDGRSALAKGAAARAERSLGRLVSTRRAEAARAADGVPAWEDSPFERGRALRVPYEPPPRATLLRLEQAVLRAGERVLARDVRLSLGRGARVHVAGPNGAGKTTLLAALLSASTLPPERVLVLPQELDDDAARASWKALRALDPRARGHALAIAAALGADAGALLGTPVPSPGEARKRALALGLARAAWLLVLDEPTNHLDLPSIERLEAALADYPGALLLVSHDPAFAAHLTTERWTLERERVVVSASPPTTIRSG